MIAVMVVQRKLFMSRETLGNLIATIASDADASCFARESVKIIGQGDP